ncbi:PTS system mannose/fructose/N-acetylgalactosamine-transporter subunit IIB [Pectinatus frisingensis]|uniref:PTS system mannose/fructose/N-acetylgalactosamine-transporter subunit IIB n=1 Tax=Pectinatus frisingensis TaxID=865 RepID=UPI0018C6C6ED|nr:PTS sugar transporter subunit IIB [Pectinatus frisingensis]
MDIVLARVDERLIHGQVAINWSRFSKCERILICSDEVADDELRSTLLVKAVPPGIKANVISLGKAVKVYNNPKYNSMKVMLLFQNPKDAFKLMEGGVAIRCINVGGMPYREGKQMVTKSVSLSNEDIEYFKKMHNLGIELEIRTLPTDKKIDLAEKINF